MGKVWHPNKTKKSKKWSALDPASVHPSFNDKTVSQSSKQGSTTLQHSDELISVRDSADIEITTTDTKAAVSIQAALQAAIVVVLSISIADSQKADQVAQELLQKVSVKQTNRQRTLIRNSRNVRVTTTDTDLAVNIQLLLQILLALLVKLDIL